MLCPLCGTPGRRRFAAHGIPILDCPACRHRFAGLAPPPSHIDTVYADAYFHGGGAGYPDYLADANLHRQHGRRYGKLLSRFQRPGRILDVGAAAGFILQGMTDTGWTGAGIEPNVSMAAFGRDRLGLPSRRARWTLANPRSRSMQFHSSKCWPTSRTRWQRSAAPTPSRNRVASG